MRYYPEFVWRDGEKQRNSPARIAGLGGRDFNAGPPKYELGVPVI
jgi:hypothetical protein